MPPYRLAHLTPDQMLSIEELENELGLTLIAYEPGSGPAGQQVDQASNPREGFAYLDSVGDLYEHFDPHI